MGTLPSFFVIQGRDRGTRFELEKPTLSIGRDVRSDIRLQDTEVSRRHAELRQTEGGFTIHDLGSSNGTFVNGTAVSTHSMQSGDQLLLGRTLLLYTGGGASAIIDGKVDIVSSSRNDDSRILHSMTESEGSRSLLQADITGSESPWLARARSNLQVMYRTALAVSHTLDIDELLDRIMGLIFEWVEADRGCIMLVNNDTGILEPKVRRNREGISSGAAISISKTILDYVTEHAEGVLTSNAKDDKRWDTGASILNMDVREAICVPMRGRYGVVGVIYIDTSSPPQQVEEGGNKFREEHLKLMIAIAHQAALAVEDTSYYSAMLQAERLAAMGQTIATLSHHIKNILQGIRGGSYLIEMGLADDDKEVTRRGWHIVEKNQGRISNSRGEVIEEGAYERGRLINGTSTRIRYQNGNRYSGQVKNSRPEGRGELFNSRGSVIARGDFKNGSIKTGELYRYPVTTREGNRVVNKLYTGSINNFSFDMQNGRFE